MLRRNLTTLSSLKRKGSKSFLFFVSKKKMGDMEDLDEGDFDFTEEVEE